MAVAPLVAASAGAQQLDTVCGAHQGRQKSNWQVQSQRSLRMSSSSCPVAVEPVLGLALVVELWWFIKRWLCQVGGLPACAAFQCH